MKVKIFETSDSENLEKMINDFLNEIKEKQCGTGEGHDDCNPGVDIKYQTNWQYASGDDCGQMFSAMIIYS